MGYNMELNKKLQELRKQNNFTQQELAEKLYVSRTAVSKWESGRGYPNIDSLKAIARFFGVTVDELLSSEELLDLAQEDSRQREVFLRDLTWGLLDLGMGLLFFLPLFAAKEGETVKSFSLLALTNAKPYLQVAFLCVVLAVVLVGILTLSLQSVQKPFWNKGKTVLSLSLGVLAVLLFIISSQPYAAVFAFSLLAIKAFLLIKRQ